MAFVIAGAHFGMDPATLPDRWTARQVRLFARLAIEDRERIAQYHALHIGRLFSGKT